MMLSFAAMMTVASVIAASIKPLPTFKSCEHEDSKGVFGEGQDGRTIAADATSKKTYCVAQCEGRVDRPTRDLQSLNVVKKKPQKSLGCCKEGYQTTRDFVVVRGGDGTGSHDTPIDWDSDATLVTQGGSNRLQTMLKQAEAWGGPMVAVFGVYNNTAELHLTNAAVNEIKTIAAACSGLRGNIRVVVVVLDHMPDPTPIESNTDGVSITSLFQYPINSLRNIAVDQAQTNWVLSVDMDFVPSITLRDTFLKNHSRMLNGQDRVAVVVPHFELATCPDGVDLPTPKTAAELLVYVGTGLAFPFAGSRDMMGDNPEIKRDDALAARFKSCKRDVGSWPAGIKPTDYAMWAQLTSNGAVGVYPLHPKNTKFAATGLPSCWEPFVLAKRFEPNGKIKSLPRYSESYFGRFKNKVEWILHLRAYNFKFFAVASEFIVHVPHERYNRKTVGASTHFKRITKMHKGKMSYLEKRAKGDLNDAVEGRRETDYKFGYFCTSQEALRESAERSAAHKASFFNF